MIWLLLQGQAGLLVASEVPVQETSEQQTTGQSRAEQGQPDPSNQEKNAVSDIASFIAGVGSFYAIDRASTLVHELGHAVTAVLAGCSVNKLYVSPWLFGEGRTGGMLPASLSPAKFAAISLAGPIAGMAFNYFAMKAAVLALSKTQNKICRGMSTGALLGGGLAHIVNFLQLLPFGKNDGSVLLGSITSYIGGSGYAIPPAMITSTYYMTLLLGGLKAFGLR